MKSHKILVQMIQCALFSALLCIFSPMTIPIGVIPFTMGVFAVMLCGVMLEWKMALISVVVFLALGMFLPVFSGGNTSLSALPGPTGGYIWSFVLMAPLIGLLSRIPVRHRTLEYVCTFGACVIALAVCYLCGTLQYVRYAGVSFRLGLEYCVFPFAPWDLVKAAAAALIGVTARRLLIQHFNYNHE